VKYLNEIKSVLVSTLASHGQMSDALDIYEEVKQAGHSLVPKAVIHLIVSSSLNYLYSLLVNAIIVFHSFFRTAFNLMES
jgi:pentatricopeptide repeat protein